MQYKTHLLELKRRVLYCTIFFVFAFLVSYLNKDYLYQIITLPLKGTKSEMIFTGIGDAFFSYLYISFISGICVSLPFICYHIYFFIGPGLYKREKNIASVLLLLSPILFITGCVFVLYIVMPKALAFFMSFEKSDSVAGGISLILQPKIDEYFKITVQLMFAFGLAFQMPIILIILCILKIINVNTLKSKRRIAIVCNFIIAGILTPPDVLSQILLAIPLVLLYEIAIISSMILEKKY